MQVHEFNPFVEQQREIQTLLPHSSVLEENVVRNGWARINRRSCPMRSNLSSILSQSSKYTFQWSRKQSHVAGATDTGCGCGFDY